jgi:hypothetical protein
MLLEFEMPLVVVEESRVEVRGNEVVGKLTRS